MLVPVSNSVRKKEVVGVIGVTGFLLDIWAV